MDPSDDTTLVQQAKAGDEAAFAELVERHQGRVYHHALRLMGSAEDAEEVLQDTFLQVFRNLDRFEERSRFSTWIYRIATNEALMRLRKARRKREVFLEDAFARDGEHAVEQIRDFARSALDDVADTEIRAALDAALAELPEEYRVVFTMRDIDGLTNAEVAEVLEISVPAVKSRLHRSRLYLRDRLSRTFRDSSGADVRSEGRHSG
ncbi:MAG: RNA polymerase sigma factor [Gemmatimonadota bacterium]|nr:MAG: RNA polymerase sigma factor [Gemmatimonadota bacterium]